MTCPTINSVYRIVLVLSTRFTLTCNTRNTQ